MKLTNKQCNQICESYTVLEFKNFIDYHTKMDHLGMGNKRLNYKSWLRCHTQYKKMIRQGFNDEIITNLQKVVINNY